MLRWFYIGVLQLHPAAFRSRFGDEMLDIFECASGRSAIVPLLADALVSLVRQWVFRPEFRRPVAALSGATFFHTIEPHTLSPIALLQGVLLSVAILGGVGGMIGKDGSARVKPGGPWSPQATPVAAFDAASIKRSKAADPRRPSMEFLPGGRFRSVHMPLFPVLATAYGIPWQSLELSLQRIKGMPDWMISEPYDIEAAAGNSAASPGATAKARNARIRLMLQTLLAERLKMRVRRDETEMEVWAMTVGKAGPRMEKSKIAEQACTESVPFAPLSAEAPGCHQFQGGMGRGIRGAAVDMSDLALHVSNWSDLPVVDQTGLAGLYAIQTEGWGGDVSRPALDEVLDRLGLKLTRKKARLEVLVIEHVERPSEN